MSQLISVASVTFRESIRNRTVLAILLLGLGFAVSALLLAEMALDQRVRVITDWGLFCLSAFGVALAILMGVSLMQKEITRKTLYVVLSRPLSRWQYVLGKFLGEVGVLAIEVLLITAVLITMLGIEGQTPGELLFRAVALSAAEIVLVAALALFFSSFSSPYLSGFFALSLFVIGRSLEVLEKLIDKIEIPWVHALLKSLFYVLPDFASFNLAPRVVNDIPIGGEELGAALLYTGGYGALLIIMACLIFGRRELV